MKYIITVLIIFTFMIYVPFNSLHNRNDSLNADSDISATEEINSNDSEMYDKNGYNPNNDLIAETEKGNEIEDLSSCYVQSKISNLAVRADCSLTSTVIGRLDKGDMVAYLDICGKWYKTVYKNRIAYVSAKTEYSSIVQLQHSNNTVEKVIDTAESLLGFPYVYGAVRIHNGNGVLLSGFDETKFDCSSLVQYAYYKGADILLNVNTRTQIYNGNKVSKDNIQRGDLLFFTNSSRYYNVGIERIGHVAIYLGNNYILHTASDYAVIEQISATRWNYFIEARHVI